MEPRLNEGELSSHQEYIAALLREVSSRDAVFQVVFLKNRGVLVGGESIEEAFHLLRRVMNAVDTQVCVWFVSHIHSQTSFNASLLFFGRQERHKKPTAAAVQKSPPWNLV